MFLERWPQLAFWHSMKLQPILRRPIHIADADGEDAVDSGAALLADHQRTPTDVVNQ
jgi:hypothetical protein